jgi:phosphatidylinositol 4-kinase
LPTTFEVLKRWHQQGVIDVIPNATSRDEMGRAKVNDLLAFFQSRFPGRIEFETARNNFIKSMAAYSLVCYIIQIKDRHNGNIMIDGDGHITHIDFGFLFDIGPGGIKFEPNSFKLTHEMVDVMGGVHSPGYKRFNELLLKAFLACRPYASEICATASLMMGTDLPSFKGQGTIDRLMERFRVELSDEEAVKYMKTVIADAQFSGRSILYDRFQRYTNEIPFKA